MTTQSSSATDREKLEEKIKLLNVTTWENRITGAHSPRVVGAVRWRRASHFGGADARFILTESFFCFLVKMKFVRCLGPCTETQSARPPCKASDARLAME